jgi:DNA repair protein RadA/Sms
MSKSSKIYICQKCGAEFLRWMGKCEACGEWNSLVESQKVKACPERSRGIKSQGRILKPQSFDKIQSQSFGRIKINISEFDRVLGGGIVPGSVILLGGEPGIGKSTLVLQAAERVSQTTHELNSNRHEYNSNPVDFGSIVLYVSGEESAEQVKMRADRLNIKTNNLAFLSETNIDNVVATIQNIKPSLVILDSIQTVFLEELDGPSGSIGQVKGVAAKLISCAKENQTPVILIGHVTKEGAVAGPKTLEHLVDTVLYLEGDRFHNFRILRASKNRFGSTSELGVFEMKEEGFSEVKNPSSLFLEERKNEVPGSCVAATLEGSRSFLIEIQALTSQTFFGYPRRTAAGYDFNRLQLLIAVLSKRARLKLDNQDIYINVAGGIKIKEPAADLACILAIASAYLGKQVDPELVAMGEVGLSGEIRSASQIEKRIKEAESLGFKKILIPNTKTNIKSNKCEIVKVKTVQEAVGKALIR